MPIVTDIPSGQGALNDWILGAGASKTAAMATNDGDTSYVWAASSGIVAQDSYTFPNLPLGTVSPVVNCKTGCWVKRAVAGGGNEFYAIWDSGVIAVNLAAAWAVYTNLDPLYDAGATSVAACNGSHGFKMVGSIAYEVRATMLYRTTNYLMVGGFVWFLGMVGACGANLLLSEMPKLAAGLSRRRLPWGRQNIQLSDAELVQAWQEWREYRHPVWSG